MRFRPPLRVSVTRHEEKEHKLQEFLVAAHRPTAARRRCRAPLASPARCPLARQPGRQGHHRARRRHRRGRPGRAADPGPRRPRAGARGLGPRPRLHLRDPLGQAPAPGRGARAAGARPPDLLDRRLHAARSRPSATPSRAMSRTAARRRAAPRCPSSACGTRAAAGAPTPHAAAAAGSPRRRCPSSRRSPSPTVGTRETIAAIAARQSANHHCCRSRFGRLPAPGPLACFGRTPVRRRKIPGK